MDRLTQTHAYTHTQRHTCIHICKDTHPHNTHTCMASKENSLAVGCLAAFNTSSRIFLKSQLHIYVQCMKEFVHLMSYKCIPLAMHPVMQNMITSWEYQMILFSVTNCIQNREITSPYYGLKSNTKWETTDIWKLVHISSPVSRSESDVSDNPFALHFYYSYK